MAKPIQRKLTIIFPPGDIITSVLFEKEKDTIIEALLTRLCKLRAVELSDVKCLDEKGEKLDTSKTVGVADLMFIELIDKKTSKKEKTEQDDDDNYDYSGPNKMPLVPGITLTINENVHKTLTEQLFPNEIEALKQMKLNYEVCNKFSDEYIMACLFARKLDLIRTHAMLQATLKWRSENNLQTIPRMSEIHPELLNYFILPFGLRLKDGTGPIITNMNKITPNKEPYTLTETAKFLYWFWNVAIFSQGIDLFRNGMTFFVEMDGYGWKNFDYEWQTKFDHIIRDKVPARVKKTLILHPPLIYYALFKICSVFMKAKVLQRIQPVKNEQEFSKLTENEQLWSIYGGKFELTLERQIELLKEWCSKNEDRLLAHQG